MHYAVDSEVFRCVICVFEDILKQFLAKFVGRIFCVVYPIPFRQKLLQNIFKNTNKKTSLMHDKFLFLIITHLKDKFQQINMFVYLYLRYSRNPETELKTITRLGRLWFFQLSGSPRAKSNTSAKGFLGIALLFFRFARG